MLNLKKNVINMINIFNYKFLIYVLIFIIISVLLYGNYNLIEGLGDMTLDESLNEKNINLDKMNKDIENYKVDNSVNENKRQMDLINTKNKIDSISENFQNCNSYQSSTLGINNDGDTSTVDPNYIAQSICDINNNLEANVKIKKK